VEIGMTTKKKDMVNHPPHYNNAGIECIEYIKQQTGSEGFRSYLEGSIIKYIHRFKYKDQNIRDLEKAVWYINRLIKELNNI
jgi:CRISPR/Cas system-associated protein Cas5 (RAMP superfamily)|tara:strand:+ start:87 stop:332 length:246 start_codon:yes stop_codon:yes gene_type:complete